MENNEKKWINRQTDYHRADGANEQEKKKKTILEFSGWVRSTAQHSNRIHFEISIGQNEEKKKEDSRLDFEVDDGVG